jgi:hypothetical protein
MKKTTPAQRLPRRPDLSWAERLLGETLQPLSKGEAEFPAVKPKRDATVIPIGGYCYYTAPIDTWGHPCPYYKKTSYGTSTCAYTGVEAYGSSFHTQRNKVERHFGSAAKAAAAGVVTMIDLPDRRKICNVNGHDPSYVNRDLTIDLIAYEDCIAGEFLAEWVFDSELKKRLPDGQKRLLSAGWLRFYLWEALCSMVEPVPVDMIERIVRADTAFKAKTEPTPDLMDDDVLQELPDHADPSRQFWYFYRKNKPDAWLGATGIWGSAVLDRALAGLL